MREPLYLQQVGSAAVTAHDVIDIDPTNPRATVIADLRRADAISAATYDCIILTQTLHLIDYQGAVLAECARLLRPGGCCWRPRRLSSASMTRRGQTATTGG